MRSRSLVGAMAIAVLILSLFFAKPSHAESEVKPVAVDAAKAKVYQIGLISSLFRGNEAAALFAQSAPFSDLMHLQTGLRGQFSVVKDGEEIGKKLMDDEIQLAVIHGVELAWIMKKYPDIKPIVLPYNTSPKLKALILVPAASEAKSITDLKGKVFSFPKKNLNHCYLYMQKLLKDNGHDPAGYFAESPCPANMNDAIETVVDGEASGIIVDEVTFNKYAELKPGRAKKLKVLCESPVFPTAAMIYKPSDDNKEMAKKFKEGLMCAHEKPVGKQLLLLWRLTNFGDVTDDYPKLLEDILKEYPNPIQPANFFPAANAKKPE